MKSNELYPLGVRRDGSYYTRIEWASCTEKNPQFWVLNIIDDDLERSGGTFAANSLGPVDVVLSFFGETKTISSVRFYSNVGLPISVLEELAKQINVYVSVEDTPRGLKADTDDINSVEWEKILECAIKKEESWQEFSLSKPVQAKYVRIELVENYGTSDGLDWIETSEVKIYP